MALLAFAGACSSGPQEAPAAKSQRVNWQRTENGVVVRLASGQPRTVRLQVMTGSIIRVTATPADSLNLPASLMVVATPLKDIKFDVSVQNDVLSLKTANAAADVSLISGKVKFRDASGRVVLDAYNGGEFTQVKVDDHDLYAVRQQFNRGTDEDLYGLGQHENGQYNYNGQDVDLAQHNMDIALPLVVSSRNYGLLWDNNGITRFGDPREYRAISTEFKLTDADGRAGGLTARYALNGQMKVTRVESDVNYQYIKDLTNWPAALMDASGGALPGKQSVTWEGRLESDVTGVHKFRLYVSSYVKLYLDGKLVIDAWRQNWNPWYRNFDVPMTAGVPVSIRLEWIPNGGYIRLLHANPLPADERHEVSFASEAARAIDYYFIAGRNYDDVISGYRQLTGKSTMLPRWAFGYWQSRDRYKTQEQLVDTLREYRRRKLPIDNIVQDWRYWRDDSWGSHAFDAGRYPDPAQMVNDVHALHGHIMISVWPKFYPATDNYKALDAVGGVYHGNIDAGAKDWVGSGYLSTYYDPYNARAADIYWQQIQDKLGKLGFDAWWLDNDEPDIRSNLDIAEREAIMGPTAIGSGAEYFNTYPLVHVGVVYDHWHALHPDTRVLLFTRSAYGGIQRYSAAVWSGDLAARWSDLHDQIAAGLGISMAGMPNWTFDIGGFAMEDRFVKANAADLAEWRELYTRWFQFGAFAPIFRAHGQARPEEGEGRPREIYRISAPGTEVYDILAWYDRLRYRLMPYIYTLASRVYHDDDTMMRGLVMDFPQDPNVRDIADEYMFGPSFLVAPVTQYKARTRLVYLPAGVRWYDFYTGKAFDGGQQIAARAPLRRMPLFVREGSIVPIGPDVQYTGQKPDAPITLNIYTGKSGRFDLYEDDGVSYGYARGEWSRIPIRYDEESGTLTIGKRQGAFPGMVLNRIFNVRWISGPAANAVVFDAKPDRSVRYSGGAVELHRGEAAGVTSSSAGSRR
jgi:alpha-D-xyloside xylohydrolase